MKNTILGYTKAIVFSFTVTALLAYSLFSFSASAIHKSAEGYYRARVSECQEVGEEFGTAAESALVGKIVEETTVQAALFVAENPKVSPYAAAWYGYGYCMGLQSLQDDAA